MGLLGRLHVPLLLSILLIAAALGCIALGLVWKLSIEFVDLAGQLPAYKETLDEKIHSLSGLHNSNVTKASEVFSELETELLKASSGSADQDHGTRKAPLGSSPSRPVAVQVVAASNRIGSVGSVVDSMGWVGLTIIFAVVILMGREDLRNRFIHLSSGGRLTVVTQALDEATKRIQKYLFLQSAVNAIYGVVIGTGLYFIGIPDAWL
jgi:predicted PurR-regulated permease PerM